MYSFHNKLTSLRDPSNNRACNPQSNAPCPVTRHPLSNASRCVQFLYIGYTIYMPEKDCLGNNSSNPEKKTELLFIFIQVSKFLFYIFFRQKEIFLARCRHSYLESCFFPLFPRLFSWEESKIPLFFSNAMIVCRS